MRNPRVLVHAGFMQLPFFKKPSSPPKREYLFALEIDHFGLKSAIWGVFNDKPQVLSVGNFVPWDDQTPASLVTAVDQSLSDATSKLDPNGKLSPSKVILGLPPDWVESDKILPVHLQTLKQLSRELSLNIVGYVITPEAAVKFLQSTDGVPPTAILLGFWAHHLEVTLVRLGKIDAIHEVSRSSKVIDDVTEGLARFSHLDMLPSRILLYDSGLNLEDIRQQLLAHPWQAPQTRLPFLHFPKVEILPSDFTIRAIAVAGGSEVARAIGILPPDVIPAAPSETPSVSSAADLGFYENDVVEPVVNEPEPEPEPEPSPEPEPAKPLRHKFTLPNFRFFPLLIIFMLAALSVGGFAAFWYLPRATVTLHLASRTLGSQIDLTADTSASSVDISSGLIPAKQISVTVDGDKTAPATGSKLIGDKATGSVTIVNSTPTSKTFPAGTAISSPSGLKFTLDSDAQVASASGTADNISLGKATVNVTAAQIGSDSNLSAGTYFRIGTFASLDVVAKNDVALSGGSSRQVKAVSKDDIAGLRTGLLSTLSSDISTKLQSQLSSGQIIIPNTIQTKPASEKLDHQEGDVADQVSLHLSVNSQALTISQSDLDSLVREKLKSQIPDGYSFTGNSQQSFVVKKTVGNTISLSVQVSATVLPVIDQAVVIKSISGLSASRARTYLGSLAGVSDSTIAFNIPLPPPLLILPHIPKHITLDTRSD